MLQVRNRHQSFGRGSLEFLEISDPSGQTMPEVLAYNRVFESEQLLIIQNLSDKPVEMQWPELNGKYSNLFTGNIFTAGSLNLEAYEYLWLVKHD